MSQMQLPNVNYRISADYGRSVIAKTANSQAYDLFGLTMNICTKINSKASTNGMVIGNDLYEILSSLSSSPSFFDDYCFKGMGECLVAGLKQSYLLYSVVSKYKNENITMHQQQQQQGLENSQLPQELDQKQDENLRNILLVDDEPDVILTYKSILIEEGYNVKAFTDPREALRHFA
jgi:two-component system, OmpR family, response regulator ChvI